MGHIRLIAAQKSDAVDRVTERLEQHFGSAMVVRDDGMTRELQRNDALIVFIDAALNGEPNWSELDQPSIEAALAQGTPLIPVLVDGARMPTEHELPPAIRALAHQHALPVRSQFQLNRDVGRLIVDLESQLHHLVGVRAALDLWLLPVGALVALMGTAYSIVYVRDVTDWSFGYETVEGFQRGVRWLTLLGPGALGAGMLLAALGWWWRCSRRQARLRAEHFRSAVGPLPDAISPWAWSCLVAGFAALGWGAIAAAFALLLGMGALLAGRKRPLGRAGATAVGAGLAVAAVGTAWTVPRWRSENALREALVNYEQGQRALALQDFEAAHVHYARAIEMCPHFANAHYRLAQALQEQGRAEEAFAAVNRAIDLYPKSSQSMFGPNQDVAAAAYDLRAELHEQRGDAEFAVQDRKDKSRVTGFINIFGGLFRFWEPPASDLPE